MWLVVAVVVYMLVSDPAPQPMANVYPPGYAAMNFDVPSEAPGFMGMSLGDAAVALYGAAPPVEADTATRPATGGLNYGPAARGWNPGPAAPVGAPPAASDVWPPLASSSGPVSQARFGRGAF